MLVRLSLDERLQPGRQATFRTLKSSGELSYVCDPALTPVSEGAPAIADRRLWTVSLN